MTKKRTAARKHTRKKTTAALELRKKKTIAELELLAENLRSRLVSMMRPFVIEFSGTPKSGKTSTANSLDMFLRRNGFKVHMIGESGAVSPISDKRDFKFNVWTGATSLCWLLEALDKRPQFIIMDRGVFDALAWIQWHADTGQLTDEEKTAMEQFYLIRKWRWLVDIVFLMTASQDVALRREHKNLLTEKNGRIMENNMLETLVSTFHGVYKNYGKQFRNVELIDTSKLDNVQCGEKVVRTTLQVLNSAIMC